MAGCGMIVMGEKEDWLLASNWIALRTASAQHFHICMHKYTLTHTHTHTHTHTQTWSCERCETSTVGWINLEHPLVLFLHNPQGKNDQHREMCSRQSNVSRGCKSKYSNMRKVMSFNSNYSINLTTQHSSFLGIFHLLNPHSYSIQLLSGQGNLFLHLSLEYTSLPSLHHSP